MNWLLKTKIVEKYRTQSDFAMVLGGHESDISRVIRGRRTLNATEKERWASLLEADSHELFEKEISNGKD